MAALLVNDHFLPRNQAHGKAQFPAIGGAVPYNSSLDHTKCSQLRATTDDARLSCLRPRREAGY